MITSELIQQGLSKIDDESAFREWAAQWMPECSEERLDYIDCNGYDRYTDKYSLADLAFRAREMAGDKWVRGYLGVAAKYGCNLAGTGGWMAMRATPYHWIIAGCCAMEMQKQKETKP
jgi:hypothetical protein